MKNFIKNIKTNAIAMAIILIVSGIIFFLYYYLSKNYSIHMLANASFVVGAFVLGIGILMYVGKAGFFDFLGYGFSQFGHALFSKNEPNKYSDYYEYQEGKKVSRKESANLYLSFIFVSIIYFIMLIIFEIIIATL